MFARIDCKGGAHFACEVEAVGVHVGDDDMAGTGVAADGSCHYADRTSTCDKDIFAEHGEREGGVGGIT